MKDLLTTEGIEIDPIPVKKLTRESFVAVDDNTNSQHRFGFPGAVISAVEKMLLLKNRSPELLVVSGSISEGLPLTL
jgi:6-phosphofructokinase 2